MKYPLSFILTRGIFDRLYFLSGQNGSGVEAWAVVGSGRFKDRSQSGTNLDRRKSPHLGNALNLPPFWQEQANP